MVFDMAASCWLICDISAAVTAGSCWSWAAAAATTGDDEAAAAAEDEANRMGPALALIGCGISDLISKLRLAEGGGGAVADNMGELASCQPDIQH